jgi:hypothetical protein
MTWRCTKFSFLVAAGILAITTSSYSDSATSEKRDKALKGIQVCLKRNEVSSRACKNMNKDIETLMDVYRKGDKSVLPTLLRFTYLSDFYDDALIADADGFLSTVMHLPEQNRLAVADGIAGGLGGLLRPRFDVVRATLMAVPDSSPNYQLAQTCVRTLETVNAALLVNYFPPQTFTGPAGDFQVRWYSRDLYALEEKPLWPVAGGNERIYRITVLAAFSGPETVILRVLADGSGQIKFRTADLSNPHPGISKESTVNPERITEFTSKLDHLQFWQLPAEVPQRGYDGAEWILEVVQDGKYHVVLRWCPGKTPFGEVARDLFKLAGQKSKGSC